MFQKSVEGLWQHEAKGFTIQSQLTKEKQRALGSVHQTILQRSRCHQLCDGRCRWLLQDRKWSCVLGDNRWVELRSLVSPGGIGSAFKSSFIFTDRFCSIFLFQSSQQCHPVLQMRSLRQSWLKGLQGQVISHPPTPKSVADPGMPTVSSLSIDAGS